MNLIKFVKSLFKIELPLWSGGLECEICKMTFNNAECHYKEVIQNKTLDQHKGRIPILKK